MHGGEAALDMEPLVHSLLEVSFERAVCVSSTARVAHLNLLFLLIIIINHFIIDSLCSRSQGRSR